MENLKTALLDKCNLVKNVTVKNTSFCPNMYFITLDYLEPKDYPNGLIDNTISLTFLFDSDTNTLELRSTGHVYLGPSDKLTQEYKYLAMKNIQKIHVDFGGKKFRKAKVKNTLDIENKISTFANAVMSDVIKYTGGYPYKNGIL
jgi:hypothetical protein